MIEVPSHTVDDGDAVDPTVGNCFTSTVNVCGDELPQALFDLMLITPPVEEEVASMELVVEEPVQPDGKVHK